MRPVRPPEPNTRWSKLTPPPKACDAHLRVYGPPERYPLAPDRNYDADPHSTLDDYLRVHRALGLERAVIVTGSGNGTRKQGKMDAVVRMKGSFRTVALLDPAISDAELFGLRNRFDGISHQKQWQSRPDVRRRA
ncbi:MAG: hypothetical protein ACM37Z_05520 [Deltaproteobacteria bacterium]